MDLLHSVLYARFFGIALLLLIVFWNAMNGDSVAMINWIVFSCLFKNKQISRKCREMLLQVLTW